MTKPISCKNHSVPAYSGITINITNPTLNAAPMNTDCPECCMQQTYPQQPTFSVEENRANNDAKLLYPETSIYPPQATEQAYNNAVTNPVSSVNPAQSLSQDGLMSAYPPQYYLNNYNYIQNGEKGNLQGKDFSQQPQFANNSIEPNGALNSAMTQEEDMSSSQGIINELDARVEEQKELEKNGKQQKVVALTNEYIMSLENYLNNPNTDIRLMASKEVLTRLDEDKTRYDDAALNALLNKMLQDPEKLIRIAALSAFSSQLASGNDYTVKLLTDIQNNPDADKEDALQAADSLLKMSSSTEIRYVPVNNQEPVQQQVEQE